MKYDKKTKKPIKKKTNSYSKNSIQALRKELYQLNSFRGEKKRFIVSENADVGQVNNNFDGNLVSDITPEPPLGDGATNRTGDAIKLYSSQLKFQFSQQDSTSSARKVRIMVFEVLGAQQATGTFEGQLLLSNPMVSGGIRDYFSFYNNSYRSQYKLIATKHLTVQADNVGGQRNHTECQINLRYNKGWGHAIRYSATTSTTGQLMMIVQTDAGNIHPTATSSVTGLVANLPNTGLVCNYTMTHYYYDN